MKKGGRGGARTQTGLRFEKKVDFYELIEKIPNYQVVKNKNQAGVSVLYKGELVARCFRKYEFYKFLKEHGIDWKNILSRKLLPDEAMLVFKNNTIFIFEIKYQEVTGSVDEKLQTCDFKKKQYQKLTKNLGYRLQYVYVLNDWFKKREYRDVLEYIESVNCHYKFNEIPLEWLGLPID